MTNVLIFSAGILFICLVMAYIVHSNKESSTENAKLIYFGAVILTGIGLIFILAMAMFYFDSPGSTKGKEIFDSAKTLFPPVVTLILGYYFGKKQDK